MSLRLAAAALIALGLPALAAARPAATVDGVTVSGAAITLAGNWPDACTPEVQAKTETARRIDVLLGAAADHCLPAPHPFRLEIRRGDTFSPAPPPDAIRPLRIFAPGADGRPVLIGLRLVGGRNLPRAPGSGFWWPSDAAAGNAVSLEVQGDKLGIALLSHDANGAPAWYFGTATLTGAVTHAELSRVSGGSPFKPDAAVPLAQPALRVDIAFASATRARMWLSRQAPNGVGLEVAISDLQRRRFDSLPQGQDWLGRWLLAGSDGLPRALDFVTSSADHAGTLRLATADGAYTLECWTATADADSPAQQCVLRDASGAWQVRFDHVGLDRLDGADTAGQSVVLLRPRGG